MSREIPHWRWWLAGVVALAAGFRIVAALQAPVIGTDSPYFLMLAQNFYEGQVASVLSNTWYHPWYPIQICYAVPLIGDFVASAKLVSILFASLALVPLCLFLRDIAGARVALLSGFLYAVHPTLVELGGSVMTEGVFHGFYIASVALGWFSIRKNRIALGVLAGVCAAFAYMTRVEGLYLLPYLVTIAGVSAVTAFRGRDSKRGRTQILIGLSAVAAWALFASPYLFQVRTVTGSWGITQKGWMPGETADANLERIQFVDVGRDLVLDIAPLERPEEDELFQNKKLFNLEKKYGQFPARALVLGRAFIDSAFYPLHLPFVVAGVVLLIRRKGWQSERAGWLLLVALGLGYMLPVTLQFLTVRPFVSSRYFLGGWPFLFVFGGVALDASLVWLNGKHRILGGVVLVLVAAICAGKALKAERTDQLNTIAAGETIQKDFGGEGHPLVMAFEPKVAWYANGRHVRLPREYLSYDNVIAFARSNQIAYIAGGRDNLLLADVHWFDKVAPEDLVALPVDSDPESEPVFIYRVTGVASPAFAPIRQTRSRQ
jgi:hypothetical protein